MPRGQHCLMVAARSSGIPTTLVRRAASTFRSRSPLSHGPSSFRDLTAVELTWTASVRALRNAASFQKVVRHAMKQYADAGIASLQNALFDHMNSDDLKKL